MYIPAIIQTEYGSVRLIRSELYAETKQKERSAKQPAPLARADLRLASIGTQLTCGGPHDDARH
jgi:hypothetical protein